jgi:hypothetical protein
MYLLRHRDLGVGQIIKHKTRTQRFRNAIRPTRVPGEQLSDKNVFGLASWLSGPAKKRYSVRYQNEPK